MEDTWEPGTDPGPAGNERITANTNPRTGRSCVLQSITGQGGIHALLAASYGFRGPQHFSLLPKHIRNLTSISADSFNQKAFKQIPSHYTWRSLTAPSARHTEGPPPARSITTAATSGRERGRRYPPRWAVGTSSKFQVKQTSNALHTGRVK